MASSIIEDSAATETMSDEAQEASQVDEADHSGLIPSPSRTTTPKWYEGYLPRQRPHLTQRPADENPNGTLRQFMGVTIPTILSMFSSLLFLRVGYIIGNAGLIIGLVQLVLAYAILICTICSISAIATNGSIKGGGVYFMISRTLGPQLGGSVGILFYSANVVSGALYASGFAETLVTNFGPEGRISQVLPDTHWYRIFYAIGVLAFCLAISLIGAKAFSQATSFFGLILFGLIVTLLLSIFYPEHRVEQFTESQFANCTGPSGNCTYITYNGSFTGLAYEHGKSINGLFLSNLYPAFNRDCEIRQAHVSFFTVFGVLFAGVTGIMAGANVSGDLKNPSTAIPNGTLHACLITFILYVFLFLFTAMTCDKTLLYHDCLYMMEIDMSKGYAVLTGALLVTSCACLNCLIGASRVVEALVQDTMFGRYAEVIFGQAKVGTNPILAVLLTFVLMMACLLIGSLNKIAQLSSVLFLLSYLTVNMACLFMEWASAPNFRPKFKSYSIYSCLVGVIGSLVMMFVISVMYSAVCLAACLLFIILFNFTSQPRYSEWGSIGQALIFHQVRKYLLLMDVRKDHVKFWRPQILLMISNPKYNCALIDFINALKKSGLYILGHVYVADFDQLEVKDPSLTELPDWLSLIDHLKVKAFPEITVAKSVREGVCQLARISGIGAMKPNTIILGFGQEKHQRRNYFADETSKYRSDHLDNLFSTKCDEVLQDQEDESQQNNPENSSAAALELMTTVSDMLRLEKNVCLARNFDQLNRSNKCLIDVWLIDFFEKPNNVKPNPADSFMLQLGTILTMAQNWKNCQLRVFIRIMEEEQQQAMTQQLSEILAENRIPAQLNTINFSRIYSIVKESGAVQEDTSLLDLSKMPDTFMEATNDIIKSHSESTIVTFLKLPFPPDTDEDKLRMHQLLKIQSQDLPPVLFVHGIKTVVSTSL